MPDSQVVGKPVRVLASGAAALGAERRRNLPIRPSGKRLVLGAAPDHAPGYRTRAYPKVDRRVLSSRRPADGTLAEILTSIEVEAIFRRPE